MDAITDVKSSPVPRWLQIRYGQLFEKYRYSSFTLDQAKETLQESKEVMNVILSRLRKSGWLSVAFDQEDFRKRQYTLNDPQAIFTNIRSVEGEKDA